MDKALQTIQICIKANKIYFGEKVYANLKNKKICLILLAEDIGADNKKRLMDKASTYQIPYVFYQTKDCYYSLFKKNISYFGISDYNLAKKFQDNLSKGGVSDGKKCNQ